MAPTTADQPPVPNKQEECGWCKFMKAGPCRQVFEGWQACVDGVKELVSTGSSGDGGGNHAVAEHCAQVTAPLFECMAKHRFYYGSQLDGMASRSKDGEQQPQQQPPPPPATTGGGSSSSSRASQEQQQQQSGPGAPTEPAAAGQASTSSSGGSKQQHTSATQPAAAGGDLATM